MNYTFVLIDYEPDYFKYVINTVLSVDKNAEIYILSNKKINYKNTNYINLNDIYSDKIKEYLSLNVYKNSIFHDNPLWKTSSLRVLYLNEIKKYLNIKSFVHLDNDILIYKPFEEIQHLMNQNRFNITQSNSKTLIFGYSYFGENEEFEDIANLFIEKIKYGIKNEWKFNNGKPLNEMQLLAAIYNDTKGFFKLLPSLPYQSDIIFDPASYGQYLDGTHAHPKKWYRKGHFNQNDYVGVEIISKRIKINFSDKQPVVKWEGRNYNLANLHVHSKRLEKFLPKNYKEYI